MPVPTPTSRIAIAGLDAHPIAAPADGPDAASGRRSGRRRWRASRRRARRSRFSTAVTESARVATSEPNSGSSRSNSAIRSFLQFETGCTSARCVQGLQLTSTVLVRSHNSPVTRAWNSDTYVGSDLPPLVERAGRRQRPLVRVVGTITFHRRCKQALNTRRLSLTDCACHDDARPPIRTWYCKTMARTQVCSTCS